VRTSEQVSLPAPLVVPVSLYRTGDDLWRLLRGYKDGRDAELRRSLQRRLARLLSQFLRFHLACISPEGAWRVTAVPPTRRRPEGRALERMIRTAPWMRRRYVRTLRTQNPPEHNRASDSAFRVTRDVDGQNLLLVDDTFTTGASVQSAASVLQLAGARLVAVIVLGRVVNPHAAPQEAALWKAARAREFRLDVCCLPAHRRR
jgi:predicted amidophosphoribosyltransferase